MFTRVPSRLTAVNLWPRPLASSNTGSPRFTDFPLLCACSESSLTNLIGSGLNLLCLLSHSKTECRWTRSEVAILGADQKEHGLWGREWEQWEIGTSVGTSCKHILVPRGRAQKGARLLGTRNVVSTFTQIFHLIISNIWREIS